MGKLIGLVLLVLLGFYIAWPAYSLYQIKNALDGDNVALLESKVDFDAVRLSLRPAVTLEVEQRAAASIAGSGAGLTANEALVSQIKKQLVPRVVDAALVTLVTPQNLIRVHREGSDIRTTISAIVAEKLGAAGSMGGLGSVLGGGTGSGGAGDLLGKFGKAGGGNALGGLFGQRDGDAPKPTVPAPAQDVAKPGPAKPGFGLSNVKTFGLSSPLRYYVGLAKDPTGSVPDVTAELAFSGGHWRLVGVTPKI